MKKIHLSCFKTDVDVPDNISYFEDGPVASTGDHSFKLDKKYEYQRKQSIFLFSHDPLGRCSTYDIPDDSGDKNIHLYWQKDLPRSFETFLRGHEETHVLLDRIEGDSQKDIFYNMINKRGFDASRLIDKESEFRANIGGLVACQMHHIPKFWLYLTSWKKLSYYNPGSKRRDQREDRLTDEKIWMKENKISRK